MAKTYLNTVKYMIHIDFVISGIVEKPDIIGAIFGQSEGLLGDEMDLKELQKNGKVGRIEINSKSSMGRTKGEILVPSSMDMVQTSTLAAGIETVDKVGPCDAEFKITNIEDVRGAKREIIKERAKVLLQRMMKEQIPESNELTEEIRGSARKAEIVGYGKDKVPAGPDIDDSDELIVVEGRADVLNLLKNGIKNAIGMGGSQISPVVVQLSRRKKLTVFVDGDRGGELNARKLKQIASVAYVARAPDGKEVEELTGKEILLSLKRRVPADEEDFRHGFNGREHITADTGHEVSGEAIIRSVSAGGYSAGEGRHERGGFGGRDERGYRGGGRGTPEGGGDYAPRRGRSEGRGFSGTGRGYSGRDRGGMRGSSGYPDRRAGGFGSRGGFRDRGYGTPREPRDDYGTGAKGAGESSGYVQDVAEAHSMSNGGEKPAVSGESAYSGRERRSPSRGFGSRSGPPRGGRAGPRRGGFGRGSGREGGFGGRSERGGFGSRAGPGRDGPGRGRGGARPSFGRGRDEGAGGFEKRETCPRLTAEEESQFIPVMKELSGSFKARLFDSAMKQVGECDVKELIGKLGTEKGVHAVVFDGIVTQRLASKADESGVGYLVGMKRGKVEGTKKVKAVALGA
ncbi:MAG: DNA primase DnaG [Candidatus Diapherotrites archaeon]